MKKDIKLLCILFFFICNKNYSQKIMNLDLVTGINHNDLVGDSLKLESQTFFAFKKMKEALQYFEGEHDFSAFRSSECQAKSPVRTMSRISLTNYHPFYLFKFSANGFLHHQIRNMMGAILYIGKGNYPSNYIEELLLSKDRTKSPPTFSPDGLYLSGVDYDVRYAFPFMRRTVNIFDNNHL